MLIYLLQANICLIIFYLVYMVFFRKHTSHGFNRIYLLSVIFLSILIPWIEIVTNTKIGIVSTSNAITQATNVVPQATIFTLSNILIAFYAAGVVISLFILVRKVVTLLTVIRSGNSQMVNNHKVVAVSEDVGICSFFRYIIIPKTIQDNINELELAHEKSHISQYHSIDIILAWIFQSVFWFNPVAYLFKLRLMEVHEFLADEAVIKQLGKSRYQNYILDLVSQKLQSQLAHNFNSIIKMRLIMMNSKSKPNRLSYIAMLVVFSFLFFQFSCKTKMVPQSTQNITTDSPWVVQTTDLNDPRRKWITEEVFDTTVVIDYDTYEERLTIVKTQYQYTLDTIIIFDSSTFEETISIVKTYRGAPPGFLGI